MSMHSRSDPTPRAFRRIQKSRMAKGLALLVLALAAGLLALQACGGEATPATATPTTTPGNPETPTETPAGMAALTFPDLEGLLGTKDLGVGTNRISFVLQTSQGLVTLPQIQVRSLYDGDEMEKVTGRFHLWPFGTRGNYVSEMTFDKAGDWQIEAVIASGEETLASAVMDIEVKEETFTPINWLYTASYG